MHYQDVHIEHPALLSGDDTESLSVHSTRTPVGLLQSACQLSSQHLSSSVLIDGTSQRGTEAAQEEITHIPYTLTPSPHISCTRSPVHMELYTTKVGMEWVWFSQFSLHSYDSTSLLLTKHRTGHITTSHCCHGNHITLLS